jgi:hypothetical protein
MLDSYLDEYDRLLRKESPRASARPVQLEGIS